MDTNNIKWLVTNIANGTLSVEFELMPQSCGRKYYTLYLDVNKNVANAEECKENISVLEHSRRTVLILQNNTTEGRKVSPCNKVCFI
jgi:hypothetical protein